MRSKIVLVLAISIVAAACGTQSLAETSSLDGVWTGVLKVPDGDPLPVTNAFKVDRDKLTGTATSPAGILAIADGKVTGDSFSFKLTVDGTDYPHTGKLHGDICDLIVSFGGQSISTTFKRVTEK